MLAAIWPLTCLYFDFDCFCCYFAVMPELLNSVLLFYSNDNKTSIRFYHLNLSNVHDDTETPLT